MKKLFTGKESRKEEGKEAKLKASGPRGLAAYMKGERAEAKKPGKKKGK